MNRNPVVNGTTIVPLKACSRPIAATRVRMNARCTVCDAAKPKVNRSLFAFSQRVAAAGTRLYSALARNAPRNSTNDIRAVARIATRIVISSIMVCDPIAGKHTLTAWCRQFSAKRLTSERDFTLVFVVAATALRFFPNRTRPCVATTSHEEWLSGNRSHAGRHPLRTCRRARNFPEA